jgi:copper homeostasis protein
VRAQIDAVLADAGTDAVKIGMLAGAPLVRAVAAETQLPLRVMVRENDGFTCAGEDELQTMQRAARALGEIDGVEGLVVGFIRGREIDHDALEAILSAAPGLRATFHRAFDALPDPRRAILELKRHRQIDRILSGGEPGGWEERIDRLSALAAIAEPEIQILPGGSVDLDAVRRLSRSSTLHEAHVGRAVRVPKEVWGRVSAELVREYGDSHRLSGIDDNR